MPFGLEYNTVIVLVGTALLGAAAGVIGTFGLLRGRALMGDALSHATLPGICIAFLLFGKSFSVLLLGALASGIVGVVAVVLISRYTRIKEDAGIGIVLSVFFGAGLALSDYIQRNTPDGAQAGINSFILGRTAGMVRSDVILIGIAALVVIATVVILYKEFKLLCFDPDFAAVEGWPVVALDLLLLLVLAITTVIGLPAVGVVLMVAMLILPAAAARFWVEGLGSMLLLSACFGTLTGSVGTLASASSAALPAGPIIVLSGTAIFVLSMALAPRRGLLARLLEQRQIRRRRLLQGVLRALYEHAEKTQPRVEAIPIARLVERRGWSAGEAAAILASARKEGWAEHTSDGWRLTKSGLARAGQVVRVHRLWEHYLLSSADIDRDLVDPDVEVIESILPTDLVRELETELTSKGRMPRLGIAMSNPGEGAP